VLPLPLTAANGLHQLCAGLAQPRATV
jgi:hypothetical protein